jgi:hypothetical protein
MQDLRRILKEAEITDRKQTHKGILIFRVPVELRIQKPNQAIHIENNSPCIIG